MGLRVTTRGVGSVTVFDVTGRVTLGEGCKQVGQSIRDELAKGNKKLLLNLGGVAYIDSSGIGELVSALTTVSKQAGQLKLLNPAKKVYDLLQITKVASLFDIQDDEAKAITSFERPAGA